MTAQTERLAPSDSYLHKVYRYWSNGELRYTLRAKDTTDKERREIRRILKLRSC